MQEIALFSGKIYTVGKNFTRLPVVTVATNLNSVDIGHHHISVGCKLDRVPASKWVGAPD